MENLERSELEFCSYRCRCWRTSRSTLSVNVYEIYTCIWALERKRESKRRTRPLATKSDCQLRASRETLTATAVPPSRPQCRLVTRCREDWPGAGVVSRARVCICVASHTIVGSFTRTHVAREGEVKERSQFTPGLYWQFMRQPLSLTHTHHHYYYYDCYTATVRLSSTRFCVRLWSDRLPPPDASRYVPSTICLPTRYTSLSSSRPRLSPDYIVLNLNGAIRLRRARGCDATVM